MASFRALEKRLERDELQLHDFLWSPGWKGDAAKLLADVVRDAKALDAFLRAGGKLRRHAESLAKPLSATNKEGGESLFELLSHAYFLTAAAEAARRRDYARAGECLEQEMGSVTIGVCANAGCFEFVTEWESRKTNFETYMGKLADFLEGKGISGVGHWKRMVSAAYGFRATFDGNPPKAEQDLLARAAIANAAWATLAGISIRKRLGSPPGFPYEDFAHVVQLIADRL